MPSPRLADAISGAFPALQSRVLTYLSVPDLLVFRQLSRQTLTDSLSRCRIDRVARVIILYAPRVRGRQRPDTRHVTCRECKGTITTSTPICPKCGKSTELFQVFMGQLAVNATCQLAEWIIENVLPEVEITDIQVCASKTGKSKGGVVVTVCSPRDERRLLALNNSVLLEHSSSETVDLPFSDITHHHSILHQPRQRIRYCIKLREPLGHKGPTQRLLSAKRAVVPSSALATGSSDDTPGQSSQPSQDSPTDGSDPAGETPRYDSHPCSQQDSDEEPSSEFYRRMAPLPIPVEGGWEKQPPVAPYPIEGDRHKSTGDEGQITVNPSAPVDHEDLGARSSSSQYTHNPYGFSAVGKGNDRTFNT